MFNELTHRQVDVEINPGKQDWIWDYEDEITMERFHELWVSAKQRAELLGLEGTTLVSSRFSPTVLKLRGWVRKTPQEIEEARQERILHLKEEIHRLQDLQRKNQYRIGQLLQDLEEELENLGGSP